MILVGLWCNKEKPTMNMFLKPLVDAANELYNEGKEQHGIHMPIMVSSNVHLGIEVCTPLGNKRIRAAIVCLSCDLPARAAILNMKQFNGKNGCHLCEDDGESPVTNRLLRYWPYNSSQVLRTRESLEKDSCDATLKGEVVSSRVS